MDELKIRAAEPGDLTFAFAMVTAAGRGMVESYMGAGSAPRAERVFAALWEWRPNQFNYRNALVAEGPDGSPMGLITSYAAHSGPSSRLDLATLLRVGGWGLLGHYLLHPGRMIEALSLPEGERGELYIGSVATAEAARGRGTGSALIAHVCAQALRRGLHKVSLLVAHDNTRARALYEKLGFRADSGPGKDHPLALRMVLDLSGRRESAHGEQ